jgi:hypothetical protein
MNGTEVTAKRSLDKSMPTNLFPRTHDEEEENSDGIGIELGFVEIDVGDLLRSKGEDKG